MPPCTGPNYQPSTSSSVRTEHEDQRRLADPRIRRPACAQYRVLPYGGEGGIRTPGTLIRGTHDFQSCTFNRSVTSPTWEINHLCALPCVSQVSMSPKCLHGAILGTFRCCFVNLTQQIIRGKDEMRSFARYTIGTPVMKKNSRSLPYLLTYVSTMFPNKL